MNSFIRLPKTKFSVISFSIAKVTSKQSYCRRQAIFSHTGLTNFNSGYSFITLKRCEDIKQRHEEIHDEIIHHQNNNVCCIFYRLFLSFRVTFDSMPRKAILFPMQIQIDILKFFYVNKKTADSADEVVWRFAILYPSQQVSSLQTIFNIFHSFENFGPTKECNDCYHEDIETYTSKRFRQECDIII